ncbi:MAG: hypothetical protein ABI885_06350 [Gammaproteobacteria bacterium]
MAPHFAGYDDELEFEAAVNSQADLLVTFNRGDRKAGERLLRNLARGGTQPLKKGDASLVRRIQTESAAGRA